MIRCGYLRRLFARHFARDPDTAGTACSRLCPAFRSLLDEAVVRLDNFGRTGTGSSMGICKEIEALECFS